MSSPFLEEQLGPKSSNDVDLAARFFGHLDTPLTSLTVGTEGLQSRQSVGPAAEGGLRCLSRSLAGFTRLRCLSAVLPRDHNGHSIRDALTSALPSLVAALH